jgi:hypothetical protein
MSAAAKESRRANHAKAMRLVGPMNDPYKSVDASSWKPDEALQAGRKTGARPVRARIYKLGGKIQGDRADRHPGRTPRASGGRTGTGPLSMTNVPEENKRDFGSFHEGGYKRGGAPKAGQDMVDMKSMVHKHEKHDHKGEPLTKLKDGGGTYMGGTRPTGGRMAHAKGGKAQNPGYNKDAVNSAIRRQKIGGKEAAAIHRVLSAPTLSSAMRVMPTKQSDIEGEPEKRGGRTKHARGGRTKGKTNIKIVINAKPDQPPQQPMQGVVRPPPPPMPPPQMPPPAAGGPPGAGAMPGGPPGMPPPMAHKRGGKVYRSAADMDAGADSGLGRLQKTEIQEHRR